MSAEQIQDFAKIFSGEEFPHGNRRPVQPRNGRMLLTDLGNGALSTMQKTFTAE